MTSRSPALGSVDFTYTGAVSGVKYCKNNSASILRCQCCRPNSAGDPDVLEDGDRSDEDEGTPRASFYQLQHDPFSRTRRRDSIDTLETHQLHEDEAPSSFPGPETIQHQPSASTAMVIQLPPKAVPPLTDRTGARHT
ncbi:hypothetical protein NMY22_g8636 [Coprinellus aureogranulatus]|nr:hypothetical protein NMY22_g8636 [Coprinellus aureogranulatus]